MDVCLIAHSVPEWKYIDSFLFDIKSDLFMEMRRYFKDDSPEAIVEIAGRICYNSFYDKRSPSGSPYIRKIIEHGHGSVLEHATFTFLANGLSRATTHELIRHRAGCSYSEMSLRYCDPLDVPNEELLKKIVEWYGEEAKKFVKDWFMDCISSYDSLYYLLYSCYCDADRDISLSERKELRGVARYLLPLLTPTRIVFTMNARAVRNFLEQRGSIHADWEIRQLALKVYEIMRDRFNDFVFDFEVKESDKEKYLECKYHKV